VAHKIAPPIAVGAPIVLKPAPQTPLSALKLGELLSETDLPQGMFSVLPVQNERAAHMVEDPRLPVVSFTGTGPVGWQIKDAVPRKHVTLQLGGNAAVVVCGDYDDLEWAATRIATFSNYQAGQSCIAGRKFDVGGVIIGDVPSFRADQLPYGGVKGSGIGREGLRSAMDDYTEERVLVLTGLEI
jgi:acyl-CoA reductase-like NAD-dependent aldehyde dehydrogenase